MFIVEATPSPNTNHSDPITPIYMEARSTAPKQRSCRKVLSHHLIDSSFDRTPYSMAPSKLAYDTSQSMAIDWQVFIPSNLKFVSSSTTNWQGCRCMEQDFCEDGRKLPSDLSKTGTGHQPPAQCLANNRTFHHHLIPVSIFQKTERDIKYVLYSFPLRSIKSNKPCPHPA